MGAGRPQTAGNTPAGLTGCPSRPRLGTGVRGNCDDAQPATEIRASWSIVPLQRPCDFALPARRHFLARAAVRRTLLRISTAHAVMSTDARVRRPETSGRGNRTVMVAYATGLAIARFYTTTGTISEQSTEGWQRSTQSAKETRSQMVFPKADSALVRSLQPDRGDGRARSDARDRRLSRQPTVVEGTAALSSVAQRSVARIRQGAVFCQQQRPSRSRSLALVTCGGPDSPVLPRHFWDLKHER